MRIKKKIQTVFTYCHAFGLTVKSLYACGFLILLAVGCNKHKTNNTNTNTNTNTPASEVSNLNALSTHYQHIDLKKLIQNHPNYISNGFDFPVGKPNAKGYYNAQKFQENNHLGDDWNGTGGGNSDLGDSIYAIANGYVTEVKNYKGGWGNVVRIVHLHHDELYESIYAHCDTMLVHKNQFVKKGAQIATIGNCNGRYFAHLHLEIRNKIHLDIGTGYSKNTNGFLDPTDFINKNRH